MAKILRRWENYYFFALIGFAVYIGAQAPYYNMIMVLLGGIIVCVVYIFVFSPIDFISEEYRNPILTGGLGTVINFISKNYGLLIKLGFAITASFLILGAYIALINEWRL